MLIPGKVLVFTHTYEQNKRNGWEHCGKGLEYTENWTTRDHNTRI